MLKTTRRRIYKQYGIPHDIDIQSELTEEQINVIRRCVITYQINNTLNPGEVFVNLPNGFAVLYKNNGNDIIFDNNGMHIMKRGNSKCFSYTGTQIQK